jgi:hypothetical protein
MKGSGRVSLMGLLSVFAFGVIIAVFFFGKESLTSVGARFMNALAKGDVDTLTKMTYSGNRSPENIRKEWEFAVHNAGKYYNFRWNIVAASQADANNGSVRLQVVRNADNPSSYEENFALPLVKVGDEWKVDVKGISREMYPALPR